jgi:transposase
LDQLFGQITARDDPALCPPYEEKRRAGKHHLAAVGAIANKLVHIIYAVLRDNKPCAPAMRQM